ncbi:ankyrin repeat domain-containing protein [Mesoterricola silvestris]|uniref:Ankyrin repeat protein n=1 Tax=Mesoterricola silvestris TaxID=2927979 RepID=A0AA48KB25_9BACT|nr:ankyrin repeat domain-containing protein [Mesoterricola silvestris]BDU72098.1 hypothetical protein METEAL_12720 [Mesoterricola silvestris]
MPSRRLPALLAASLCLVLSAEIPVEQAAGLYEQTDPGHRELSPLWGMVVARSGILRNLRFFGAYGPEPRTGLPRHPGLPGDRDHPQDPVAGVIQYLFPSPDGVNFVPNQRTKDPIGNLSRNREEGLRRILVLLEAITVRKARMGEVPSRAVEELGRDAVRILEPTGVPGSGHDRILGDFASMLARAVQQEVADGGRAYPPRIVELALLGYAWKVADEAGELYRAFMPHLLLGPAPPAFRAVDPPFMDSQLPGFLRRLDEQAAGLPTSVPPGEIALFLDAHNAQGPLPELLSYGMAGHHGASYPDCGETSLRNFFNIAFTRRGVFSEARFQALLQRFPPDGIEKLLEIQGFYHSFPRIQDQASQKARDAWSAIVSQVNLPGDPLPVAYRDRTHNLRGVERGPENLLNLVAHLIPDPVLNLPWPESKAPHLDRELALWRHAALGKVQRLCELVSQKDRVLAVKETGGARGNPFFRSLVFTLDGEAAFAWEFWPGHYALRSLAEDDGPAAWVARMEIPGAYPLLRAWARGLQGKPRLEAPWELYAMDLGASRMALAAIHAILRSGSADLRAKVPLLVEKSVPVDPAAYDLLAEALYRHPEENLDPPWYPIPSVRALPPQVKEAMFGFNPEWSDFPEWVRFWLDHGLDPSTASGGEGERILHWAALRYDLDLCRRALRAGAKVNLTDNLGRTPLLVAVTEWRESRDPRGDLDAIIQALLDAGADPGLRDAAGESPLGLARKYQLTDLLSRFERPPAERKNEAIR